MHPMSPTELKLVEANLGLGPTGTAGLIGVEQSTVRAWKSGQNPIPMPVAILLRILNANRRWGELLTIGYGGK